MVRDLPQKVRHQIMVPFTDVAFFPGRLVHTNELLVLLGSDLYAERSAAQTLDLIARRRDTLREKIGGARAGVDAMDSRAAAMDAVRAADSGGEGYSLGGITEVGDGGGDATDALRREGFTTRQDGRATLVHTPGGTVEITEVYNAEEALEDFGGAAGAEVAVGAEVGAGVEAGAGATSGARTEVEVSAGAGAVGTERELDDFIAKLEALEAGEGGEGDEDREGDGAEDEQDEQDDDGDEDQADINDEEEDDYEEEEEDAGFSSGTISSPADMYSFERWKAKQQLAGYDVGQHRQPGQQPHVELRDAMIRHSRGTASSRDLETEAEEHALGVCSIQSEWKESPRDLEREVEAEENARANKRAAHTAAQQVERTAAATRRHAAVKDQVAENVVSDNWTSVRGVQERAPAGSGGMVSGGVASGGAASAGAGGEGAGARPMSKFKMRMMGIESDEDDPY